MQTSLRAIVKFLLPYVQKEDWIAVTYQSTWSDSTPVVYRRNPDGRVFFRGAAARSGGALGNICVLPAGYRPPTLRQLHCSITGGTSALVQVQTDGVVLYSGGAGAVTVSLDSISFETEA